MPKAAEFELIDRARSGTPHARRDVAVGIGDDGAVLRVPAGRDLVVAMDTLVAGVHFPVRTSPEAIGWKALAVNLSDLAAMGAEPAWATLAMTLPRGDTRWVHAFSRGFSELAARHRVALVGGDTTRGPLAITVQAHGFVPRARALLRSGAKPGDCIWVSGTLGDAAAGLAVVQKRLRSAAPAHTRALRARLDKPEPRVALGLALRGIATSAIDVSDGLLGDLGHVLAASRCGAAIDASSLPASDALRAAVPDDAQRIALQLAGGDDYELCFTAPVSASAAVAALARRLRVPITAIGETTRRRGTRVRDANGREVAVGQRSFEHFA